MKRWTTWIAGALALTGLAIVPAQSQAKPMAAPDLIPMSRAAPADAAAPGVAPTCQYGYYRHGYRRFGYRPYYGYRRHFGYRRYGYRRPFYGYGRPFGYRRPYGYRHRYYRPIGFYGRPYGYGYRHYGW